MAKKKIIFRSDAGINIGYGHFVRSLALAQMLKNDFDCAFATRLPSEYQKNEISNICRLIQLNSEETKFEDFINLLSGEEIVVLDNYFFSTDYQRNIKEKGCKLVCIDDIHDKHYVADVVINHGLDNPKLFSIEPYTKLCLGLDWALLRKPFIDAAQRCSNINNNMIERVVVNFGGVDYNNLTTQVIESLKGLTSITRIDAIVGDGFLFSKDNLNKDMIFLHRNISAEKIVSIFKSCDAAILSASTVCIEALACGTKIAAGYYVDNQIEFYQYLKKSNYIYGLGDLLKKNNVDDIPYVVSSMNRNDLPCRTNSIKTLCCRYINLFSQL